MATQKSSPKRNSAQIASRDLLLSIMLISLTSFASSQDLDISGQIIIQPYGYEVVRTYPHDSSAFTQGLVWEDGMLYEGTGLYGLSQLREVDLETGSVKRRISIPGDLFGEGIAIVGSRLIQLTWQSGLGIVYDKKSFKKTGEFRYSTEGWGLTSDGKCLIMSDGTEKLHFLDPETFEEQRSVTVLANKTPVKGINELEYIKGKIYANIWPTSWIAIISPESGRVLGAINMSGLKNRFAEKKSNFVDVQNGIAYDAARDRIFVTGKLWPNLFEVKFFQI